MPMRMAISIDSITPSSQPIATTMPTVQQRIVAMAVVASRETVRLRVAAISTANAMASDSKPAFQQADISDDCVSAARNAIEATQAPAQLQRAHTIRSRGFCGHGGSAHLGGAVASCADVNCSHKSQVGRTLWYCHEATTP